MALSLLSPPASRGPQWVRLGLAEAARQPLSYAGLFAVFMLVMTLLMVIPVIGGVLMLAAVPLLSLGFLMATAAAQRGVRVHAGVFLAPWRGTPAVQRQRLLVLCMLYAMATLLVMQWCQWVDGGRFEDLLTLAADDKIGTPEWDALVSHPALQAGALLRVVMTALLSIPFWHAPALVHWGGQGVAQALFSSVVALWRTRGAFMLYVLAWSGLTAMLALTLALLIGLLGLAHNAALLFMPAGLLLTSAFYVSLYFNFIETFASSR